MDFNPNKKNTVKDEESEKDVNLEDKKQELETKIREQKSKYKDLDREYERIDNSKVSTIKIGEKMQDVQKLTIKLKKELE